MYRIVSATLAALSLAACSSSEPDRRGVDRDEVLVQTSASGRAETRPDEARFSAGVETIAGNAEEASRRNNETINKVVAALERLGVKEEDIQTRRLTLNRIDYGPNRGRFQANNLIEVRMRDVAKAGEAVAATTQAGANVLSGPNLTVSDPENASRDAYAAAYRAARARAEAYAAAAGLKVARVLAIRDAGQAGPPMPYYDAPMVEQASNVAPTAAPPPPSIRPGTNTRQVQVQVDFALSS